MGSFFTLKPRAAEDPGPEKIRDLSDLNAALGMDPTAARAALSEGLAQTPNISNVAFSAAAIPVIGAVVGGLKDVLPLIGGGKKKKYAEKIVRAGEQSLRQSADQALASSSLVDAVAGEIMQLDAGQQISAGELKAWGVALRMASAADRKTLDNHIALTRAVCSDLDAAMDVLMGEDDDNKE